MNPQSPGTGGRGPYDSWGRPYGASRQPGPQGAPQQPGPQQPGPEYVYEMPEDFQEQQRSAQRDSANGNAKGRSRGAKPAPDTPGAGSWSVGPSGSPIPGMSAKDFQKMCRSVDKAFSQFARMVDQGVNEAAEALGQSPEKNLKAHKELQEKRKREKKARKAQEEAQRRAAQQAHGQQRYGHPGYGASQGAPTGGVPQGFQQAVTSAAQQAQQWAPLAKAKKRFSSSWGLTASGVVMAAAGGTGAVFFGIPALASALAPAVAGNPEVAVTAILGILTAGFATLLGFGIRNLRRASRLKALQRAVGQREAVGFDDLAARMQVSPKAALAASRTLIKGGYLPEGRIDDENTTLMVTENAYHQYRQFQQSQRQTLAEREAAEAARAAEAAARAAHEQDISERLTPEQRAFVARGRDYVRQMDELNAAIDDAAVSERITAIQDVVGRILARAEEEPAVIAGLDRLTAYYLPTTVKLLDAYDRLEEEPIQGENISSSRSEIEHTLEVLHSAFEKLFDDTYQDLSLDVSADISVLHAMLAQEGLTEGPFDVKP
ncbi:MAG TPA: 5-bromo-4-chloroindolyl phosphate hydrolysis family protein [Adlercreutzia equolifaciens]|uniref:5-bromo-4-chloroindolyl phosphate hydrolysis family protein n=1 Tax=Adlercreutzia equolifaciens TaxID=446660 RepID=UPI002431514B|nr:5-bromo-4-chloroindolyl phosphate hydrolysis family protein [Adlercreutzia equolifaciens]HJI12310.1 5-bromo-4-chloroindolyl phosphate hydrolysis family protein [Adlercreutzia equolifaciens]